MSGYLCGANSQMADCPDRRPLRIGAAGAAGGCGAALAAACQAEGQESESHGRDSDSVRLYDSSGMAILVESES
jgi:hypothetical protein